MGKTLVAMAAVAAGVALAASAQASTDLVVNGDFSQLSNGVGQIGTRTGNDTQATGWSTVGYNFVTSQADAGSPRSSGTVIKWWDAANSSGGNTWNGQSTDGSNFAALDGDSNTAALTQTINNLVVGKTYTLSFNYAFGQETGYTGATQQDLTASIGGTSWTSALTNVASKGFSGWQTENLTFVASSASETLSFLAYGNVPVPPFAFVSDVSIPGGAPEPMTWAMMILGVAALGGVARRQRATRVAAFA